MAIARQGWALRRGPSLLERRSSAPGRGSPDITLPPFRARLGGSTGLVDVWPNDATRDHPVCPSDRAWRAEVPRGHPPLGPPRRRECRSGPRALPDRGVLSTSEDRMMARRNSRKARQTGFSVTVAKPPESGCWPPGFVAALVRDYWGDSLTLCCCCTPSVRCVGRCEFFLVRGSSLPCRSSLMHLLRRQAPRVRQQQAMRELQL